MLRKMWVILNYIMVAAFLVVVAVLLSTHVWGPMEMMADIRSKILVYSIFVCLGASVVQIIFYEEHNARHPKNKVSGLDMFTWPRGD